jgi:hypothetical protein
MVYTDLYLNGLLHRHSWNIARYWYWKILQQCIDISTYESRQVVTQVSKGILQACTLSSACTAPQRYINVVFSVLSAPI